MNQSSFQVQRPDGLLLRGDFHGPDEGVPVVLIHGLGFTRRKWSSQIEALLEKGFRTITWDLRGFGESDLPEAPYSMADLVGDLEAIREMAGLERFHLVGHSFGGMVALSYAVAHAERLNSIALLSTAGHNGRRASKLARALTLMSQVGAEKALADPEMRAEVDEIVESVSKYTGPILEVLRRVAAEPDPARAFAWQATGGYSVRERLGSLDLPSMVMHGSRDELMPYVAGFLLAQALPNCQWHSLDEAPHNLPTERSAEVNAALLSFLDEVAA